MAVVRFVRLSRWQYNPCAAYTENEFKQFYVVATEQGGQPQTAAQTPGVAPPQSAPAT